MAQEAFHSNDQTQLGSSLLGHIFMKLPGTPPEHTTTSVIVDGHPTPIAHVVEEIRKSTAHDQSIPPLARTLLGAALTRSDLHVIASALLPTSYASDEAADMLCELLTIPRSDLEATYVAIQVAKLWSGYEARAASLARLIAAVEATLLELRYSPEASRKQLAETRYVLVRAFESTALHPVALGVARTILVDTNTKTISERKELAGALLSAASHVQPQTETLAQFKRLASAIFATGIAPAHLQTEQNEPNRRRISFFVTAQDAERRRQFGLASAIELHKATILLGREMSVAEYELALSFHVDTSATHPGNLTWFTREEWMTAHQLITAGLEQGILPHNHALGLLYLLISKVKAEDPTDARVSFKRIDLLDAPTRRRKLSELLSLARKQSVEESEMSAIAQEKCSRLFQHGFLIRNPIQVSLDAPESASDHGSVSSSVPGSAVGASVTTLVTRLVRDNNPTLIARLVAADFQLLKQASGLSAEEFRIVLDRIRSRAISEQWARLAFLEILRARHSPEVTPSIRTVALGLLVTEARKFGKLTSSFEKEVFAVSAELPNLNASSVSTENDSDPATTSEV